MLTCKGNNLVQRARMGCCALWTNALCTVAVLCICGHPYTRVICAYWFIVVPGEGTHEQQSLVMLFSSTIEATSLIYFPSSSSGKINAPELSLSTCKQTQTYSNLCQFDFIPFFSHFIFLHLKINQQPTQWLERAWNALTKEPQWFFQMQSCVTVFQCCSVQKWWEELKNPGLKISHHLSRTGSSSVCLSYFPNPTRPQTQWPYHIVGRLNKGFHNDAVTLITGQQKFFQLSPRLWRKRVKKKFFY